MILFLIKYKLFYQEPGKELVLCCSLVFHNQIIKIVYGLQVLELFTSTISTVQY